MSGCGDRDGPAAGDLLAEARDDAAGAAEHVAEAHEHELRGLALKAAADDLGQAFRSAHDVRRVHRLVRGHEDELLDLGRDRRRAQNPRAVGVVEHRLPGVGLLHHGHVLVGARMEDDARPLAGQHLLDQRGVLDVADDRRQRQLRKAVGERRLDRIDRRLGQVEQHELGRTVAGDVAAELGADRAAGAGDHHHAVAEPFAETRIVEDDRIAAQQVVELDRADGRERGPAADQVLVRRHRQDLDAHVGADLRDAAAHAVRSRGQRDDHLADPVLLRPGRQARDRTQHAHAVQQPAALRGVVVDEPDDAPLAAAGELPRQARAGFARADDEHRLAEGREGAVQAVLLPDSVGEAIAGHQEDEHDRIEDQHAARHDHLQLEHHEDQRDQQRAEPRGEHDALQVEHARESPQPAVETERDEDRGLQRQDPDERARHVGEEGLVEVEPEPDPVHRRPRERRHAEVVDEGEPRPVVVGLGHCSSGPRLRQW